MRALQGISAILLVAMLIPASTAGASTPDIRFEGSGWGHGVGLSLYGAKAMGADGAAYERILHRYFTRVSVVPLNAVVLGNSFLVTETKPLWVGLLQNRTGVTFEVSEDTARLCFDETDTCVGTARPGETWRFGYDSPGVCYFQQATGAGDYARTGATGSCDASVRPTTSETVLGLPLKARSYSDGILRFRWSSVPNHFHVVFSADIESYLNGLSEAPDSWSEASLRALAVTVRSSAAWNVRNHGPVDESDTDRRVECFCNLYDGSPDPVFRGFTGQKAHPNWVAAVSATRSEVMQITDGLAPGMWSSSSGGETENYVDVFGTPGFSHLVSAPDSAAFADSADNPHDSWASSYDQAVLADIYGFSWISDLMVIDRNDSGSARTIRIAGIRTGRPTTATVFAVDLRSALSLRSTTFDISVTPRFEDVPTGHMFAGEIMGLTELQITTGCRSNAYCPKHKVSRGEMAAFIVRALDLDHAPGANTFVDDDGSVFESHIETLHAHGITTGCTATRFCPERGVTRGEMAALLVRGFGLEAAEGDSFTDDDGSFFKADIEALRAAGITIGCTATTFCPAAPVTREQMAAFLVRALALE